MSLTIDKIKKRCPRFRILVLGRRNAGKTTILKKMCGSDGNDLEIVNAKGEKVDPSILEPNRQRGMSNIENEITFKSNPLFVFHDSRGIEAGAEHEQNSPLSTEYLWNFLEKRSETTKIREQVHAIWFCIPMDNPRAPSAEFELAFFNVKRSPVPVIAVFTKFESLLDEAYDSLPEDDDLSDAERDEEAYKAAQSKFKATVLKAIQSTKYPPDQFVQLQSLNEVATECASLTEETYAAIQDETLADLFALAQRNSVNIGNQKVFEMILRETQGWTQRMGIDNTQIIESVYKYVEDYIPFWRVRWYYGGGDDVRRDDDRDDWVVVGDWGCDDQQQVARKRAVQDFLPDFVTCLFGQSSGIITNLPRYLSITTVICIVFASTAQKSQKPHTVIGHTIQLLKNRQDFAVSISMAVDKAHSEFPKGADHTKLVGRLVEIVMKNVDSLRGL